MMRAWIGVALLAVSWLLGLNYYYAAWFPAWVAVVLVGAVLLCGVVERMPRRRDRWIALVLLLPAVWLAPWPSRAALLLIVLGLVILLLPIARRWPRPLGRAVLAAGVVMVAQALGMAVYAAQTARSHELPWPLPETLAGIAGLLGVDAAADGSAVVMHSIRQVHRLGATWELLVDPASFCFFVGGLVMLGLASWSRLPGGRRWKAWIRGLRSLTLVMLVWLPVRAGLLMGLYVHRVLRSDYALPLHVMNQFLSPWVHLLLLAGPVLLAWRFVRVGLRDGRETAGDEDPLPTAGTEEPSLAKPRPWHDPAAVVLVLLAVACLTLAVHFDPVGTRKAGRVMVVERHSTWEPTTRAYDTKWFGHDSGYNYAALYDYLARFYQMSRLLEADRIDEATLAKCDVLVIKTPTQRYAKDEVDAVVRFVERGGGLLLIGEHTNFSKSSTYLNDITRRMGFTFRHDLLFGVEAAYDQLYRPPRVPHPIVQHLPPMDFAISCSIDPGRSRGRAVIRETGLWSLPAYYRSDNYFPVPQHRPDMRYGAFIELWSTRHGKGRVLAFGDSTIFSNFSTFEPGKAELMLGMVEWLNHRGPGNPRPWLLVAGLLPLAVGLYVARRRSGAWMVLLAAGTCGWALASVVVVQIGRRAMPVPKPLRPMTRVVIDRTVSEVPLCKGGFIRGEGAGYGMVEQWIPRLGYFTTRRSGPEAFSGDALVVICPGRSVSHSFRQGLIRYVREGGRLLVIDSPENVGSTANSLLWPFGLSLLQEQAWRGTLRLGEQWPGIAVQRAYEISGGEPLGRLGRRPVAATARFGKGAVTAVGFGSLFTDAKMGYRWDTEPEAEERQRYEVLFALVRLAVTGQPIIAPEPPKPEDQDQKPTSQQPESKPE